MSRQRKIGLLFGGRSVEHEVSVISARGVSEAMDETDLECIPIGVTGEGRWLSPEMSSTILDGEAARAEPPAGRDDGARLVLEPGAGRLLRVGGGGSSEPVEVDAIFPLIHGWGGEDGRLQGALELAGIPYVGAGVLGSAAAMDKAVAKRLFEAAGLPGVRWIEFQRESYRTDRGGAERRIFSELELPVFVKPANGGSSVGVTKVERIEELSLAMDEAFAFDEKVVVEQGIPAREVECAVIGNEEPLVADVLGEIVPTRPFYDYAAKYLDGSSELKIPAELDGAASARIRSLARSGYRCLGLSGLARVDFLVDRRDGGIYLNEINTLPGFTPISMFPKLWEASGLRYPQLVERLVDFGLERWRVSRCFRTLWNRA